MNLPKAIHNLLYYKLFAMVDKPRDFISFKEANSIGIIYNATHPQTIDTVQAFVDRLIDAGKEVQSLG